MNGKESPQFSSFSPIRSTDNSSKSGLLFYSKKRDFQLLWSVRSVCVLECGVLQVVKQLWRVIFNLQSNLSQ